MVALAGAISALVAACGGEDASPAATTTVAVTPTPSPTPTPNDPTADANAIVQQCLQLDLASLDNYANPALPAYYDTTVGDLDNTPSGDPVSDAIATLGLVRELPPAEHRLRR